MLKKLLLLSFIEGAAVMAAELCGARLLAPVFGTSLHVWACVMGITLAALAAGYFFGGYLSTEIEKAKSQLFKVLICASLFLICMPLLSYYLVPRISYLPFVPGVIISVFIVLFLPVFFLGATSPLFILLQTKENENAGKVSGTVYAISTAGGILSTFLCAFFFIPEFGLSLTLYFFGALLFACTCIFLKRFPFVASIILTCVLIFSGRQFLNKGQIIFSEDGIYGKIKIRKVNIKGKEILQLSVNDIVQTEMDLKTKQSVSEYIQLLDTLIPSTDKGKALVLGLGGGLSANLLIKKNYTVTGVELDPRILKTANDYFFMDSSVSSFAQDARTFLNADNNKYDVILVDVFKAEEQPAHVLTVESLKHLAESQLNSGGKLYINWHGYVAGEKGRGTAVLLNTLTEAGFHSKLFSFSANEDYRNIIFYCSTTEQNDLFKDQYIVKDEIAASSKINTDDCPVLERSNVLANKTWRQNYLKYYQTQK